MRDTVGKSNDSKREDLVNILPSIHYRELLQRELIARCRRNPAYSSRAFSRDIGVSPGFLSQVIHGRKKLNEDRATRIASALEWPDEKTDLFVTMVRWDFLGRAARQSPQCIPQRQI